VREFITYTGLHDYVELRSIVRSHIIGWRKDMEKRALSAATIRRKLSAVSSLILARTVATDQMGRLVQGAKAGTACLGGRVEMARMAYPPVTWRAGRQRRSRRGDGGRGGNAGAGGAVVLKFKAVSPGSTISIVSNGGPSGHGGEPGPKGAIGRGGPMGSTGGHCGSGGRGPGANGVEASDGRKLGDGQNGPKW
jgi:hypothetical protein